MLHDQKFLNYYFSNFWKPSNEINVSSPETIAKKIKNTEWVLDVGCGYNAFKGLIKNVIGIDPAFDQADIKTTIEDYIPDRKFDVATCLGSINFGTYDVISLQIDKIVSCLNNNSRVYWRLNPGRNDHENSQCNDILFFPWSFDVLKKFADKYNYIQTCEEIYKHPTRPRLYAEWHRVS